MHQRLGRKTFLLKEKVKHTKYTMDNLITKFKFKFTNIIINFINRKIDDYYRINNNFKFPLNHLKELDHRFICSINKAYNKQLLQTKLGNYLSENVSRKYINCLSNHNEILIKRLINEDKENKNFNIIFNKTFLECLEHFRVTKNINGLEVLENEYSNLIEELEKNEEDEEYILKFVNIIYTFDNIIYK